MVWSEENVQEVKACMENVVLIEDFVDSRIYSFTGTMSLSVSVLVYTLSFPVCGWSGVYVTQYSLMSLFRRRRLSRQVLSVGGWLLTTKSHHSSPTHQQLTLVLPVCLPARQYISRGEGRASSAVPLLAAPSLSFIRDATIRRTANNLRFRTVVILQLLLSGRTTSNWIAEYTYTTATELCWQPPL